MHLAFSILLRASNKNLCALQKGVKDSLINSEPFIGKLQGTSLDPAKGMTVSFGYTITVDQGILLTSDPTKPYQDLRLSEQPLILRSRNAVTNRNCLIKHTIPMITMDCRRDLNPPG